MDIDKSYRHSSLSNVLSAFRDVIISQQDPNKYHEPTPTEYFAVACNTVTANTQTEYLSEVLQILDSVIPSSSRGIVQMQAKVLLTALFQMIEIHSDESSENRRILRHALATVGNISLMLEPRDAFWLTKLGYATTNILLRYVDAANMKIQRNIHTSVQQLLRYHSQSNYMNIRAYVADFFIGVMKACTRSEYKRSLHVVILLEKVGVFVPESKIEMLFHTCLGLESCGQPILTAAVYRMFDCCFQDTSNAFSSNQLLQCIRILINKRIMTLDMETNTYFCTSLASAVTCLMKANPETSLDLFPPIIALILQSSESEFVQVHCAVATSIKRILTAVLSDKLMQSPSMNKSTTQGIRDIVQVMETLLQLRFQYAWVYTLDTLRQLFERFPKDKVSTFISNIVKKIVELYHALESGTIQVDKPAHMAVSDAIGAALRSCGVSMFLSLAPFRLSSNLSYVYIDDSREWILTTLQNNLRLMACSLGDFGRSILSIAKGYNQLINQSNEAVKGSPLKFSDEDIHHMRMRVIQLWSLFPEFCYYGATDVATTFPRMPDVLEACLLDESYPELHQPIFLGLTHIARIAHDRKIIHDLDVLKAHSASIIGCVLKVLEKIDYNETKFQSGVQCVGAWIAIAPKKTVDSIAKKLMQLLLKSTSAEELQFLEANSHQAMAMMEEEHAHNTAAGWMAFMQVIVPHLSEAFTNLLYRSIHPLLTSSSTSPAVSAIQKRAYHILELLLKLHAQQVFAYEKPLEILHTISESLLSCPVNSRSIRLKCVEMLLIALGSAEDKKLAVREVFRKVLTCLKDSNRRTREEATSLLRIIIHLDEDQNGQSQQQDKDTMDEEEANQSATRDIFMQLVEAVHEETSLSRSAGVIGMCMLMLEKRDDPELMQLAVDFLPSITSLLEGTPCSEQSRAVLSYVRVCAAVLPKDLLSIALPQLIHSFTDGLRDEKSKYLSRGRAIMRKLVHRVNEEELRQHIPASDLPLLLYVQRINRRNAKHKNEKQKERLQRMLGSDSDDDSDDDNGHDSDDDEMEENPRLTSRPKAQRADEMMKTFTTSADDLLDEGFGSRVLIRPSKPMNQPSKPAKQAKAASVVLKDPSAGERNSFYHRYNVMTMDLVHYVDLDESDEEFAVTISSDGKVIVKEREETAPPDRVDYEGQGKDKAKKSVPAATKATTQRKRTREPGEEYKSKKAGGDVWKKGMLQPHAYIPLDPRLLTYKKRREALTTFGAVVSKKSKRLASIKIKGRKGKTMGNRKQRESARNH
jgi:ribosomal RNA-processing protein 12